MSQHPSANTAALLLLRIGLIVTSLFIIVFLLLTQLQGSALGLPLTILASLLGLAFLTQALRQLARDLERGNVQPNQRQSLSKR